MKVLFTHPFLTIDLVITLSSKVFLTIFFSCLKAIDFALEYSLNFCLIHEIDTMFPMFHFAVYYNIK